MLVTRGYERQSGSVIHFIYGGVAGVCKSSMVHGRRVGCGSIDIIGLGNEDNWLSYDGVVAMRLHLIIHFDKRNLLLMIIIVQMLRCTLITKI